MKYTLVVILLLSNIVQANYLDDGRVEYEKGNLKKATQLYSKSCKSGNSSGCFNLAFSYLDGEGVKQNKQRAKSIFGQACAIGNRSACWNYRLLTEQGVD